MFLAITYNSGYTTSLPLPQFRPTELRVPIKSYLFVWAGKFGDNITIQSV